jgi:hypothetical protein
MPDFDRLHELASRLAKLTAPGEQEPGLASWCMFVGENWQEISRMWNEDPRRAAASELYDALEAFTDGTTRDWTNRMANARKALAKARGETNAE